MVKKIGLVLISLVVFAGCKKPTEKKIITPQDTGTRLSVVLCEKFSACKPDPTFNKEECQQQISSGLVEKLMGKKDLKLDQETVEGCVKNIQSQPCEILTQEAPPKGCEFLQ